MRTETSTCACLQRRTRTSSESSSPVLPTQRVLAAASKSPRQLPVSNLSLHCCFTGTGLALHGVLFRSCPERNSCLVLRPTMVRFSWATDLFFSYKNRELFCLLEFPFGLSYWKAQGQICGPLMPVM